jgi:hypothetical protein
MRVKNQKFSLLAGLLLLSVLFFPACEETLEEEDSNVELVADAGQDIAAEVGVEVVLDGSNSAISEGTFAYSWELTGKPTGSIARLENATTSTPSFTPDAEGEYVAELTVSAGELEDTDQVIVKAETSEVTTIEISGDINSDMVWSDTITDPEVPDYMLTGNVTLNAELKIQPGVLIHVDVGNALFVSEQGVLISEGTEDSQVVFTSSNEPAELRWKGIKIASTSPLNKLEYTQVRYAGDSEMNFPGEDYVTAVGVDGGSMSLINATIRNSGGYGFFLHSGTLGSFTENSFSGNANYSIGINAEQAGKLDGTSTFSDSGSAVHIYSSTVESDSETSWPSLSGDAEYFISGELNIKSYLEIMPGAVLKFAENVGLMINSTGVLVADAESDETIIFTSKKASAGIHWKGIYIGSNDSRNMLANTEVKFAGNSEWEFSGANYVAAVGIEEGKLGLTETTISNSKDYGVFIKSGSFVNFGSNNFNNNLIPLGLTANQAGMIDEATAFSNNEWDGIEIYQSTLNEESNWVALKDDARYRISGHLSIEAGLTLEPGVYLAFDEDKSISIQKNGYFVADGTSSSRITLTTSDVAGEIRWTGLRIRSSDARNKLNHVTLNYAGGNEMNFAGADPVTALGGDDNDTPHITVTNTTISNSGGYAIYWEAGEINDVESLDADNTFTNNEEDPDVVVP